VSSAWAGPHFLSLPDLASRPAGGAVLWANDDLFAEKRKPDQTRSGRTPSGDLRP